MSEAQNDTSDERRGGTYVSGLIDRDTRDKSWRDYLIPVLAGGLVTILVAWAINFGTTVYSGENRSAAVLTERITNMNDDVKEQKKMTQELLLQARSLYTREEAQRDREAAERRFQSMEGRIDGLGRRLELLENIYRSPGLPGRGMR